MGIGDLLSHHQKLIDEIVQITKKRGNTYGSVLFSVAMMKHENTWKSFVAKVLPLYHSDEHCIKKELDYGDFVMVEDAVGLDDFVEIVKRLPERGIQTLSQN